jgi:leucyl aminopeptidase
MTYKVLNNITLKNVSDGVLSNVLTELLVIPVNKKILASPEFKELDKKSNGYISRSIKDSISPSNQNHLISSLIGVKAKKILLINDLNEKDDIYLWLNKYKYIAKIANSIGCKNLAVLDGQNYPKGKDKFWFLETISRSIESGAYIFSTTKNKTAKTEKIGKDIISSQVSLRNVTIITAKLSSSDTKKAKIAVARGFSVGEGVNTAKHLGDLPANHATPKLIEKIVKNTVKNYSGLKVKSLNEKDLARLKMGSYLSVSKGSDEPPRMIIIEYNGGKKNEKPVALVGKGITFDTGGISLKPSSGMDEMKWDMCGAGTVFGVMCSLARIKADVNVIGIMACAENMPSARATKPGDVVTSMSGQTIEILNTDAEGRLVLADALTYVGRYKPSYVIDMATLTGAVVIALGSHASGVMANNQFLADKIIESGEETGDRAWQLPLWNEYKSCTKTNFADLANIGGGREAGTIHAAAFLSKFAEDFKWAHMDIAASAWSSSPKGGTGRPVPLICDLILNKKLK